MINYSLCFIRIFITVYILEFQIYQVDAAACVANTNIFGETSPSGRANALDTTAGQGYLLLGSAGGYTITCCGVVTTWTPFIDLNGAADGTVYFQIWRPSGAQYQLVGENQFTFTVDGERPKTVTTGTQISIRNQDRIGWYTSGPNIIKHKSVSGADNYIQAMSRPAVNSIQDWSGATIETPRAYGLRVDVSGGATPSFTSPASGVSFTVTNDKSVGYLITTLTWSDADVGDTLTASMTSSTTKVEFNNTSGTLKVASSLSGPSQTLPLVFSVTDYCGNSAVLTFDVDIVNEPPVLYGLPASVLLSEDSIGDALLYTINATDSADTVSCNFTSTTLAAAYPFAVRLIPSSTSYGIYVEANPNFDYLTKSQYALSVVCSDGYENSNTGTFYVYLVKNQAPVISNLQAATIVSTTATMNTDIFQVSVTDAENDTLTFSPLVCDPSPCPFVIRDSGAIQLTEDISGYTTTGYDLNITVTDGKNVVGPKILTIIIRDINGPVLISNLPISTSIPVFENSALGKSVFTVSISDQDTQTWSYSMVSTPATGLSYFAIRNSSGIIETAGSTLNYETLAAAGTTSFTFTITVSDGSSTDTDPLVINIIDVNEAPSFSQLAYTVSGNEGVAGSVLGTPSFAVTDPDTNDTKSYSLDCGANSGFFYLNPSSGQLSFQSNYDTDSGRSTTVNCNVTVTDSGGLTDVATLDIYVSDINDNTPVFSPKSYSFFVSYYATVGTTVGTVTATDKDTGTYGDLTITLDQSALLDQYFTIDNTGVITVKKRPYGNAIGYATSVTFNATATDAGGLSAVAPVTIVISDTTTTSTTTTTDRYRTFIEDNRNVAWLIASCVALAVILGIIVWLVYTCRGENSFAYFWRAFCNHRKTFKQFKPRRMKSPPTPATPRAPPRPAGIMTIREPPPPKAEQIWRSTVTQPVVEPTSKLSSRSYEFWKHTDFTDNRLTKLL